MFMEKMSDPSDIYLHNVLLCSSQRRKGYVGTISRDKYLGPETRIRVSSVVTWIWAISGISIIKGCPHKRIKFSLILASGSRIFNSKLHFFTKYFSKMRSLMHHYRTYKDFKACSMVHYSTTKYLFIGVSKCSLRRKKICLGVYYMRHSSMEEKLILSCTQTPNGCLSRVPTRVFKAKWPLCLVGRKPGLISNVCHRQWRERSRHDRHWPTSVYTFNV